MNPNAWIQEMRTWRSEQDRTPVEEMLNNILMEYEDGSDDTPKQEELLQLQGDGDKQSPRWGYDRCHHRSSSELFSICSTGVLSCSDLHVLIS